MESNLKAYAEKIVHALETRLPNPEHPPVELSLAMRHSCLAPGKRIRPTLCIAACEAVGGSAEDAIDLACALEMIHCFSLIHDDLPAIDNDDLRRGQPTCHKVFGEAVAILAGDALFCLAFETAGKSPIPPQTLVRCFQVLSRSVGIHGVVAGETADILAEGKPVEAKLLEFIHLHKTASLISASCEIGALCGTQKSSDIHALKQYGEKIGLAFQIVDDILNEISTTEQLGKKTGSDRELGKATYPALYGIEASMKQAVELVNSARANLQSLEGNTSFLDGLASYTVERLW